jgi:hypothetical protein
MSQLNCCTAQGLTSVHVERYHREGYLVVEGLLDTEHVASLRRECDGLSLHYDQSGLDAFEEGCVLDILRRAPVHDGHPARSSREAYLKLRRKQMEEQQDQLRQLEEHRGAERQSHAIDAMLHNMDMVLFQRLPGVAAKLLSSMASSEPNAFLFNEHYVSKPARSRIEFKWHIDEQEQLFAFGSMVTNVAEHDSLSNEQTADARGDAKNSVDGVLSYGGASGATERPRAPPRPFPRYLSAWCPLDALDETNGPLAILPLPHTHEEQWEQEEQEEREQREEEEQEEEEQEEGGGGGA